MTQFDRAYYQRFYRNPKTRVVAPGEIERLCAFVCAYLGMLDLDLRRVLDLGCGIGLWRDALLRQRPKIHYTGVEVSDYLCAEFGWQQGSVVDYRAGGSFDLVICQGVLQYLPDADAAVAIENLARLTRSALYLEALTRADWERNCDRDRTDGVVRLRTGAWYRRRLRPHFKDLGGGVFVKRDADVGLFELEHRD